MPVMKLMIKLSFKETKNAHILSIELRIVEVLEYLREQSFRYKSDVPSTSTSKTDFFQNIKITQ